MQEFFKKRIDNLRKDKLQFHTLHISYLMFACQLSQLFESKNDIGVMIRVIFWILMPHGILFGGRKYIAIAFYIFAYIRLYLSHYTSYFSFAILSSLFFLCPKIRVHSIVLYFIMVIVGVLLKDITPNNAIIHILNCCIIYVISIFIYGKSKQNEAVLVTLSESKILEELKSGKEQKQVECFSKNTVTKKLREAKDRNSCLNNAELIFRYKQNYIIIQES